MSQLSRRQSYESSIGSELDEKDFEKDLDSVLLDKDFPDPLVDAEVDQACPPKPNYHGSGAFDITSYDSTLMKGSIGRRPTLQQTGQSFGPSVLQVSRNQLIQILGTTIEITFEQFHRIQTFSMARMTKFARQRHVLSLPLVLYQHRSNCRGVEVNGPMLNGSLPEVSYY